MVLAIIVLISILQIVCYILLEKRNQNSIKIFILITILISYFYFLPNLFYNEPGPNENNCLMPYLGLVLTFGVVGGGSSLLIHFLYSLIRLFFKPKSNSSNRLEIE